MTDKKFHFKISMLALAFSFASLIQPAMYIINGVYSKDWHALRFKDINGENLNADAIAIHSSAQKSIMSLTDAAQQLSDLAYSQAITSLIFGLISCAFFACACRYFFKK